MGALLFMSLGLAAILFLPTITYLYARHLGRRPWLWFAIGIILPGIATLILSFLPDLSGHDKTT